jgi:hypothetical protein
VKPTPKVVQVTALPKNLAAEELNNPPTQSSLLGSKSVVQDLIAGTVAGSLDSPPVSTTSEGDLYDDTGALVIHKAYHKPNSISCFSWLVGLGETPELAEVQPVSDTIFGMMCDFFSCRNLRH